LVTEGHRLVKEIEKWGNRDLLLELFSSKTGFKGFQDSIPAIPSTSQILFHDLRSFMGHEGLIRKGDKGANNSDQGKEKSPSLRKIWYNYFEKRSGGLHDSGILPFQAFT
jgi:hypothetical protein